MPGSDQQKVIKDPAESKAYISASNTTDFLEKGAAMEAFVARYPASVVKSEALQEAMESYQLGGNILKVEETAKRLLTVDDSNVRALTVLTFVSRSQLAEADVTKLNDLCTSSRKGIAVLPRWQKPEGMTDANFVAMKKHQTVLRAALIALMDKYELDALVYPYRTGVASDFSDKPAPPGTGGGDAAGANNLHSFTGLPSMIVPGGFYPSDGMPFGLQLLARPFDEATLIKVGSGYEAVSKNRKSPASTPPLKGEHFEYAAPLNNT